ncbi:hypothetical protein J2Z23_004162 [Lederbergia galactosidilyticus]|nr:hypothetical protein [Lederbergia galactosidilytica]
MTNKKVKYNIKAFGLCCDVEKIFQVVKYNQYKRRVSTICVE